MIKVLIHIEDLGFVEFQVNKGHTDFTLENGQELKIYYDDEKIGFISMKYYIVYIDNPLSKLKDGRLEVVLKIDMTPYHQEFYEKNGKEFVRSFYYNFD